MTNPVGRPSKYRPEFNEKVIALMKEGASMAEVAYELDVDKTTLYEWMEKHEDFSHAIKKGVDFSEGWWTKQGRINLVNKDFSSTLWYMNMKNRFKWADKHESTVTAVLKQEDALKELE